MTGENPDDYGNPLQHIAAAVMPRHKWDPHVEICPKCNVPDFVLGQVFARHVDKYAVTLNVLCSERLAFVRVREG